MLIPFARCSVSFDGLRFEDPMSDIDWVRAYSRQTLALGPTSDTGYGDMPAVRLDFADSVRPPPSYPSL